MGSRKRVKPNPSAKESAANLPASTASQSSSTASRSHSSVADEGTSAATPTVSKATPAADRGTPQTPTSNQDSRQVRAWLARFTLFFCSALCSSVTVPQCLTGGQVHKTKSWYGSWPRVPKSSASTQVARETILGGTSKPNATADFSRFESKKASDSVSIHEPPPSEPTLPKTQEDAVRPGGGDPNSAPLIREAAKDPSGERKPDDVDTNRASDGQEHGTVASPDEHTEPSTENRTPAESAPQRPSSGWFGWLSRPAYTEPTAPPSDASPEPNTQEAATPASADSKAPETEISQLELNGGQREEQSTGAVESAAQGSAQDKAARSSGGYWFWYWSSKSVPESAPSAPETEPAPALKAPCAESEAPPSTAKEPGDVVMQDAPAIGTTPERSAPPPKAGSTWAFWSRDTRSASGKKPAEQAEQGQLAVMGESSETQPKRANSVELNGTPAKEPPLKPGQKDGQGKTTKTPTLSGEPSSRKSKRERPQSMDVDDVAPVRPTTPKPETTARTATPKTPTTAKTLPPNLLLPSFSATYRLKDNPSILQQITQLLLRTRQPSAKHVYLKKETPKIKRAIAIGVHGLFPANYLRPVIGQPTGTSIKFANHCAEAIRRWADAHGCEDCAIEKVALEGEGKIGDRVENLWKLLLNWVHEIRNADLIVIACHSQGVPVSIMLLAKLIELGIVTSARVGVCAMGEFAWCSAGGIGYRADHDAISWRFARSFPGLPVQHGHPHGVGS